MLRTQTSPALQVGVVELEQLSKLAKVLEEDQAFCDAFTADPRGAILERGLHIPQELIPETIDKLDVSDVLSPELFRMREVEVNIAQAYRPDS